MKIEELESFMERVLASRPSWLGFRVEIEAKTEFFSYSHYINIYLMWLINGKIEELIFIKGVLDIEKEYPAMRARESEVDI